MDRDLLREPRTYGWKLWRVNDGTYLCMYMFCCHALTCHNLRSVVIKGRGPNGFDLNVQVSSDARRERCQSFHFVSVSQSWYGVFLGPA